MNKIIKIFNYQFYLKEILVIFFSYLLMENIFSWLVMPNSVIVLAYEKLMSIAIFAYVMYNFNNLKRDEKIFIGFFSIVLLRLVFESLFYYGTVFQQFTMFTVLFPVVFTVFIKCVCRSLELDFLEFTAKFYLFTYIVFMAIYGRSFSFSLNSIEMVDYGPFSGDSRIIHARSIFMMIIPLIWFLHQFLKSHHYKHLIPFMFCVLVIFIHQHRSVWASAIVALLVYLFASLRNHIIKVPKVLNFGFGAVILTIIALFFVSNLVPGFTDFMADRFSEIFDPAKEDSTGKFRDDQRVVYFDLFLQKPVFGWTFEGFELPNPLVDWWPEKTGQHFHEGYMEMLFYHGIVGLLLKYSFLIYILVKAFSKKLSGESIILIGFSIAGLVFSFSYVLPLIFWGHVGMCLYYLEKKDVPDNEEETPDQEKKEYPNLLISSKQEQFFLESPYKSFTK